MLTYILALVMNSSCKTQKKIENKRQKVNILVKIVLNFRPDLNFIGQRLIIHNFKIYLM